MSEQPEAAGSATTGAEPSPRSRGAGGRLLAMLAIVIVAAAAGGIWYSYELGVRRGITISPPLIKANSSPTKVAPENPGGLEVPHQEKLVYGALDSAVDEPEVEQLLAPPEEPLPRPEPPPDDAALPPSAIEPDTVPEEPAAVRNTPATAAPDELPAAADGPPAVETVDETVVDEPQAEPASPATPSQADAVATATGEAASVAAGKGETLEPTENEVPPETEPTREALLASFRIQIGSFRSAASAERAWALAGKTHGDLLTALTHVIVRADLGADRGVFHRLQAGPFADRDIARGLCDRLKARQLGCLVVTP